MNTMPYSGKFKIASGYGYRTDPIKGEYSFHSGLDLVSLESKNVICVEGGVVLRSRIVTDPTNKTSEWGNYISIQSNENKIYYYCHLSERLVSAGDKVNAGDVIGIEGSTGRSTGSHLHFEVRINSTPTDPSPLLDIPNQVGYIFTPEKNLIHDWARDGVEWAKENGILLGDGQGNLRLGDPVTREECAVLLNRLYKMINETKGGTK